MFSFFSSKKRRGKRRVSRWIGRKLIALVVGSLVIAAGFQFTKGRVIQVADGDTIVVHTDLGKTERVRLYGIDAPESKQRGGAESTHFARDLLFLETVSLSVTDTDQYGRAVALVKLKDGRIANEEMVRAGHAWVYRGYCREAFCASWLALERQAQKKGLGLWRQSKPMPPWKWRRNNPRR